MQAGVGALIGMGEAISEAMGCGRYEGVVIDDLPQAPAREDQVAHRLAQLEARMARIEGEQDGVHDTCAGLEQRLDRAGDVFAGLRERVHACANASSAAVLVCERVDELEAWREETEQIAQRRAEGWNRLYERSREMLGGEGDE